MAAKTSWHRYGKKLRHCHPVYSATVIGGSLGGSQRLCAIQIHAITHSLTQGHVRVRATYFFRFDELELESAAGPRDEGRVGGVLEQRDEELPQLERAAPLVGGQSRQITQWVRGITEVVVVLALYVRVSCKVK